MTPGEQTRDYYREQGRQELLNELAMFGPVDETIGTPELRLQAIQMTLNYLAGSRQSMPPKEIRHMANGIIRYIEGAGK